MLARYSQEEYDDDTETVIINTTGTAYAAAVDTVSYWSTFLMDTDCSTILRR